jgi:inner membrane protein
MPSSVGHALGAMIAGAAVDARPKSRRELVARIVILSLLGAGPDLDLLIGQHRAETHSLGATLVVAGAATLLRLPLASTRWGIFLAAAGAWGSHLILDMLGEDSSMPFGVEWLWPISTTYFSTGWDVFLPIARRWYTERYLAETIAAIVRETLILGPVLVLVVLARRRGGTRSRR